MERRARRQKEDSIIDCFAESVPDELADDKKRRWAYSFGDDFTIDIFDIDAEGVFGPYCHKRLMGKTKEQAMRLAVEELKRKRRRIDSVIRRTLRELEPKAA